MKSPNFAPRAVSGDVLEVCSKELIRFLFELIENRQTTQEELDCWQQFSLNQSDASGLPSVSILHWENSFLYEKMHSLEGSHLKIPSLELWIIDYGTHCIVVEAD